MSRDTRKQLNLWFTWNYEKQQQHLDTLSERGLHLTKPGLFSGHFTIDESARYIYRLDYQPQLRQQEAKQDYLNLFQDAGWEYIGQCKSWHHFRRSWNASIHPELYTDKESLKHHYRRIQRILLTVLIVEAVMLVINLNNYVLESKTHHFTAVYMVLFALLTAVLILLGYGCLVLGSKMRRISDLRL